MDDRRDEEEQSERRRPKVVDKRISARPAEPSEPSEPPQPSQATAEVTVGSVPETPEAPAEEASSQPGPGPGGRVWTPEEEAEARRVAQEIAQTPSIEWVVNTAATLANVAGAKLDLGAVADAQLSIDALAGIVNAVGPRLQGAEMPLRQLLADLQLAYAERMAGPAGG